MRKLKRRDNTRWAALLALIISVLALVAISGAASIFLKIDGIDGEAKDKDHQGWIELSSFGLSVSRPASEGAAGAGGSRGLPSFQDLVVTKAIDKATPLLYKAVAAGEHIGSARLEVCETAGTKPLCYFSYELQDVLVTSVSTGGASGGDVPQEAVSFTYQKIIWSYTETDEKGTAKQPLGGGWNVVENQPE